MFHDSPLAFFSKATLLAVMKYVCRGAFCYLFFAVVVFHNFIKSAGFDIAI